MPNSRTLLIIAIIIGLTVATVLGLRAFRPQAKIRPPIPEPVMGVQAQVVSRSAYQVMLPSRGLISAQTQSTLAAEIAGSVIAVSEAFRKGARFQKGDWLLSIDSRDYEAALKLAEANLRRTQLAVEQEVALAEQAARDWQRLGNKKAAPQLVLREPQVEAAKADLASVQAQLDIAKVDLSRTKIHAPFNGLIINQLADVGQYLNPGAQLAEIQGSDTLEVELPISAQWRSMLPADLQEARVILKLDVGTQTFEWPATIVRRSAGIDLATRQLTLIAQLNQKNSSANTTSQPNLQVGDFVHARVFGKTLEQVFVLPRQALIEGKYVWRIENDRLLKSEVNVIWLDQSEIIIDRGLTAGDTVNITPLAHAMSGTRVEIISPNIVHQTTGQSSPEGNQP